MRLCPYQYHSCKQVCCHNYDEIFLLICQQIRIIVTEHAKHFFDVSELPSSVLLYDDNSEWQGWKQRGDPVIHIELGKWADMMVIAPLDANSLAKMAQVNAHLKILVNSFILHGSGTPLN